jgi:hypothetical protein
LWSAKWWALQAYNLVGTAGFYYLGAWTTPPLPGEVNPDTGQRVPNPINPGSIVYDETAQTIKVWNGSAWVSPIALTQAYSNQYAYIATAGQTAFSGPDLTGNTPVVGASPSDIHVNGVRLLAGEDWSIAGDVLTIATALRAGDIVQWDLLMPPGELAPGAVTSYKVTLSPAPDGAVQDFSMTYFNGTSDVPTTVGDGVQLLVSLDGCVQQPGADYTAADTTLHLAAAPAADASLWAVWYKPGA